MGNRIKIFFLLFVCLSNLASINSGVIEESLNNDQVKSNWLQRSRRDAASEVLEELGKLVLKAIGSAALTATKRTVLNAVEYPAANQCKFSFTHVGKDRFQPSGSIHSEWETEDSDINKNDEKLDGQGLQTDKTAETMSSAFYLKEIRFAARVNPQYPGNFPCISAITINCGDQVLPDGGYTSIGYQDMLNAWFRVGFPRGIQKQTDPDCVPFDNNSNSNSFMGMKAKVGVLKCGTDRDCIQRNIEMY